MELSKEERDDFVTNYKNTQILSQKDTIIPKSTLIYFHSLFENFISKFLILIYNENPQQFKDDEFKFNFNQLDSFDSLEDAKSFLINKKISGLLWRPIDEQISEIFSLCGIIKDEEKFFPLKDLIEISLRRNIFIHNDGIVNNIYLDKCNLHGIKNTYKEGDGIIFDESYFTHIYDVYYEFLIKITFKSWIKLSTSDTKVDDAIGGFLNNTIVNIISNENYDLGLRLISCILDSGLIKKINEETKLYFIINKAIVLKISGNNEEVNNLLSKVDWSSQPNLFHFAKYVLTENWGNAEKYFRLVAKKNVKKGEEFISRDNIHSWPLFFEFKKTKEFKTVYKIIFKEDFILDSDD